MHIKNKEKMHESAKQEIQRTSRLLVAGAGAPYMTESTRANKDHGLQFKRFNMKKEYIKHNYRRKLSDPKM